MRFSLCTRKSQPGFTLVELVIVLVLVGVLSVTALPRFFDRSTFEARFYFDEFSQAVVHAKGLAIYSGCSVLFGFSSTGGYYLSQDTQTPCQSQTPEFTPQSNLSWHATTNQNIENIEVGERVYRYRYRTKSNQVQSTWQPITCLALVFDQIGQTSLYISHLANSTCDLTQPIEDWGSSNAMDFLPPSLLEIEITDGQSRRLFVDTLTGWIGS